MVKHKSVVGCLESRHVHARALSHKSVAAASTKKSQSSLFVCCCFVISAGSARSGSTREQTLLMRIWGSSGGGIWRAGLERVADWRRWVGRRASERILLCDADNSGSARLEPDFPNPHFLFYFWRQQSLRRRLRIIWRRPLSLRETEIMRL
jgi:hypothetical protein